MTTYTVITMDNSYINHRVSNASYEKALATMFIIMTDYINESQEDKANNVNYGILEGDTGFYLEFNVDDNKVNVYMLEENG